MKRTQLYLDEKIWKALEVHSHQVGVSVSELVRQAIREKYITSSANRQQAMVAWVGVRKGRKDLPGTEAYLRKLRKGKRLQRFAA
jgi:metal-responsive CopG/Arc/MetJ family transcriptional regulator